jgi:small subunit ribosomal protein S17
MKKLTGIVTSDKADKTITIIVTTRKTHPIYGKSYIVSKKFAAHDEKNEAKVGDKVIIAETKPISKSKSFTLDKIVERGHENVEIAKSSVEIEIEEKLAEKKAKADEKHEAEMKASETDVIASEAKQSSPVGHPELVSGSRKSKTTDSLATSNLELVTNKKPEASS